MLCLIKTQTENPTVKLIDNVYGWMFGGEDALFLI